MYRSRRQCNETDGRYYDHDSHACEECSAGDMGASAGLLAGIALAVVLPVGKYTFRLYTFQNGALRACPVTWHRLAHSRRLAALSSVWIR